jgi:hypothetical protein
MTAAEEEDRAGTDPMMTFQVLGVFERRDLITRSADPTDSRAWLFGVASQGAALDQQAIPAAKRTDVEFFAPAGRRETVPCSSPPARRFGNPNPPEPNHWPGWRRSTCPRSQTSHNKSQLRHRLVSYLQP